MKLVNMAWVFGGLAALGLGMAAEACSSSPTAFAGSINCTALANCCSKLSTSQGACTSLSVTGPDSTCMAEVTMLGRLCSANGTGTGTGTGTAGTGMGSTGTGTGMGVSGIGTGMGVGTGTGTGTGSTGMGSGTGCHEAPAKLYPETAAGVYCPFSGVDGGKAQTCAAGQHCCEPAAGSSTCLAAATACGTGDTDWQCEGPLDCAGSAGGALCCGTGTIEMQAACGSVPAYPYVSHFTGSACAASCASSFTICSQQSECATGTCTAIAPKGNGIGYCQ